MYKNKVLSTVLSLGLCFFGSCKALPTARLSPKNIQEYDSVEKYALLVSALTELNSTYVPKAHDEDSITLFKVYKTLIDSGFPDENIFILYGVEGQTPNFNVGDKKIAERIKKYHFNGDYSTIASEYNIEGILRRLKKRLDSNDKFVFYVQAHGRDGKINLETQTTIMPYEFQDYINDWDSNSNWFIVMSCHSGDLVDYLKTDNVCLVSSTLTGKLAWIDSDWCTGELFLMHKADLDNDTDKDGIIDWEEAYAKVQSEARAYWIWLEYYLKHHYKKYRDWEIDDISLFPKIKVGKNFKKANLK